MDVFQCKNFCLHLTFDFLNQKDAKSYLIAHECDWIDVHNYF